MNPSLDELNTMDIASPGLAASGAVRRLRGVFLHRQGESPADERRTAEFWEQQGFVVEALEDPAERHSRLPDLKLWRDGKAVAYCEVKTLWRHTWTVRILHEDRQEEIRKEISEKPALKRLSDDLFLTMQQLQSGNPDHALLNFAVLINRDSDLSATSLMELLLQPPPAPSRGLRARLKAQTHEDLQWFKRKIDVCLWIDPVGQEGFAVTAALVRDQPIFETLGNLNFISAEKLILLDPAA
jgi:hypothetical protein